MFEPVKRFLRAYKEAGSLSILNLSVGAGTLLIAISFGLYKWATATDISQSGLQKLSDSYLYEFDNMPSQPVTVLASQDFKAVLKNPDTAFAFFCGSCDKQGVFYDAAKLKQVSDAFIRQAAQHELIHAWLAWQGKPSGHTADFVRKAFDLKLYQNLEDLREFYPELAPMIDLEKAERGLD